MSHRRICTLSALWCLRQPWAALAAIEIGIAVGVADVLACTDPQRLPVCEVHAEISAREAAARRAAYRGSAEAVALTPRTVPPILPRRRHEPAARVVVIECKRTRSDLLGDLRRQKMHKYARVGTHCYLAATAEALGGRDRAEALANLQSLGLPREWGVLRVNTNLRPTDAITALRPARANRQATAAEVWTAGLMIGRSLSHRSLHR